MPSTKVPSKGLRLVNACADDVSDDDSHSLDAPPIYHTNALPPSYSSRHGHQSPAAPRRQISAHSATPSSSPTGAVSAYTGLGSPHPSMHDSEVTCVSDNTGQSYRETASVFRSGSVGERDTAPTDDIGLSPRDSVSRIASISGVQEPRYSEGHSVSSCMAYKTDQMMTAYSLLSGLFRRRGDPRQNFLHRDRPISGTDHRKTNRTSSYGCLHQTLPVQTRAYF